MRKVVVSEFMSLDGVIHEPGQWSMPYWNDQIAAFKADEIAACDCLLLGRVTYQAFAAVWPNMTDEEGGAQMNGLPKHVATTTLKEFIWNASPLKGDIAKAVAGLKKQQGRDILVYGSAMLVQSLLRHNLIDEYKLLVYPVVLGAGKRLFANGDAATLKLIEAKAFSSGVTLLTYQPADASA